MKPDTSAYATESTRSLHEAIHRHLRDYYAAHENGLPAPGLYDRILKIMERPLLELTLEATRGNQIKAAKVLGINRNTLRKKITELELHDEKRRHNA